MAVPDIDRPRWINHCETLIRLEGGVLAAAAADGGMHGLAMYHPDDDLRLGLIVRVNAMVAFELNPANPVRRALCGEVEAICEAIEARGIILTVPKRDSERPGSRKARGWESAGFRQHGTVLWKPQRYERRYAWSEAS